MMVMATATAGSGSDDDEDCSAGCERRGAEVIGVDGNDEDCGADGRVFVGGGRAAATATETKIN